MTNNNNISYCLILYLKYYHYLFICTYIVHDLHTIEGYLELQSLSAFLHVQLFVFQNCVQVHRSSTNSRYIIIIIIVIALK